MSNINVSRHLIGLVAGIALGGAASCSPTRANEGHCAVREGDAFCADKHGDERRFCARGTSECELDAEDGCVGARPVDDACYSPCGGGTSILEDAECEGIAETGTESTSVTTSVSETAPTDTTDDPTVSSMSMSASGTETESETEVTSETDPTTGPVGCKSSEECTDAASPVCVDEVCSPCTAAADGDAACEEKDPGAPACRDDGECVQCTPSNPSACGDVTPICGEASACVGCTEHEQCAAGACELDTGACFDEGCTVQVNPGDDIEMMALDGCVLHIAAGAYAQSVTLAGVKVALLGEGAAVLAGETANGTASLRVVAGATVYVEGLLINGNDGGGLGVQVNDAFVWLDRTQVVANTGGGIDLSNGADATVRNCFVGGNVNDVAALDIDGATADILYSTLIGADQFGDGAALRCADNEAPVVRNSVLAMIGAPSEIQCGSADVSYSASETLQPGTGNVMLPSVMPAWFESLTDDFHLAMPPAAIETAAQWNTGDPLVDIDGDARPNVDGASDVAGADVP